jgi:hypothetical protein
LLHCLAEKKGTGALVVGQAFKKLCRDVCNVSISTYVLKTKGLLILVGTHNTPQPNLNIIYWHFVEERGIF